MPTTHHRRREAALPGGTLLTAALAAALLLLAGCSKPAEPEATPTPAAPARTGNAFGLSGSPTGTADAPVAPQKNRMALPTE